MAKMINEKMLRRMARSTYPGEVANYICEAARKTPKIDAIPVSFIVKFMNERDPVYLTNLTSMINAYNREVEEDDRIPEEIFE